MTTPGEEMQSMMGQRVGGSPPISVEVASWYIFGQSLNGPQCQDGANHTTAYLDNASQQVKYGWERESEGMH